MANGPADEDLMSAYVAGDARAFEQLFARLAPRVHAFFLRSFRDAAVADDLLQVTFMKVHKARERYDQDLRVAPWVFTVAARVRLDELRKRLRLPEDADEEALARADEQAPRAPPPDTDLADAVRQLKQEAGPDLLIMGSGTIVSQLTQERLIDEYQMVVQPIVLGAGRSMFDGVKDRLTLKRTKSRTFENGCVVLWYEPA